MSRRLVAVLVASALLVFAACGPGAGTSSQSSGSGSPQAPSASPPASPSRIPVVSTSQAAMVCRQTGDSGVVKVSIADFEFKPASIAAKVGQVVAFSNTGFEPHNATVEAGCATRTLQTGESDGLVFSVPGTYKFGCTVHAWMTGTFTIDP
jgi:plastocyanin